MWNLGKPAPHVRQCPSAAKCIAANGERTTELECVPDVDFLEAEYREMQAEPSGELQLVFDPEFL
jgi:hypothetical protein